MQADEALSKFRGLLHEIIDHLPVKSEARHRAMHETVDGVLADDPTEAGVETQVSEPTNPATPAGGEVKPAPSNEEPKPDTPAAATSATPSESGATA